MISRATALAGVRALQTALVRRLPRTRRARVALATALYAAIVAPYVHSQLTKPDRVWLLDLNVYREAGRHVLHGGADLYRFDTPLLHLPFTYPPFPALLSVWLAVIPKLAAGLVWTVAELAVVVWVTAVAFRPLLDRTADEHRPYLLAAMSGAMLWLNPARDVVKFGQVDIFIVALVLADLVVVSPRWPRGALVGIASAVKLTPGLFIPYLWLSGRRRAAAVAAATFVAAQGLALLVMPSGAWDYWSRALFESDRLGSNSGTSNQSIRGMLLRLDLGQHVTTALWAAIGLVVLVAGMRRALAASRAGDEVAAVALVGLLSVALSPVSWIHHMAWVILAVAVVLDDGRSIARVLAAVGIEVFFLFRLPWWGNTLSLHHSGLYPMRLLQDSFGLAGLALLFWLPWRRHGTARSDRLVAVSASGRPRSLRARHAGAGGSAADQTAVPAVGHGTG